jgi:periplasmic copper chaperone A
LSQALGSLNGAMKSKKSVRMHHLKLFSLIFCVGLSACGAPATLPVTLTVDDAAVRFPTVPGNPGAAYFRVRGGPSTDRLLSVSSPSAIRAEMHNSIMENGMMKMTTLDSGVEIPAGGTIAFAPRGKHVMLFDMNPKAKDAITLTFTFASGTIISAEARILRPGDMPGDHAH